MEMGLNQLMERSSASIFPAMRLLTWPRMMPGVEAGGEDGGGEGEEEQEKEDEGEEDFPPAAAAFFGGGGGRGGGGGGFGDGHGSAPEVGIDSGYGKAPQMRSGTPRSAREAQMFFGKSRFREWKCAGVFRQWARSFAPNILRGPS